MKAKKFQEKYGKDYRMVERDEASYVSVSPEGEAYPSYLQTKIDEVFAKHNIKKGIKNASSGFVAVVLQDDVVVFNKLSHVSLTHGKNFLYIEEFFEVWKKIEM